MVRKRKRGDAVEQDELFYTNLAGEWRYRQTAIACPICHGVLQHWQCQSRPQMQMVLRQGGGISYRTISIYTIRCSHCRRNFDAPDWLVTRLRGE